MEKPDEDQEQQLLDKYLFHLSRLQEVVVETIEVVKHDGSDRAYMALTFTHGQYLHSLAVSKLVTLGLHRDAGIIARTMLEGFALLAYALNSEDENLPYRWRAFTAVENYRTMREREDIGEKIDPELRARIQADLDTRGGIFLRKDAKQRTTNGEDPYVAKWYQVRLDELVKSIANVSEFYRKVIEPVNQWMHWNVGGVGRAWTVGGEDSLFFAAADYDTARQSLGAAYTSLHHCAKAADLEIDSINCISRLRELAAAYVKDVGAVE